MKKRIIFIGVSICLMLLLMVGISYASWVDLKEQTGIDTINAGCFDVQISSESNNINLTSASLMTESVGKKQENPYTFTIINTCDVKAAYTIDLGVLTETDTDNALDPKFISVYLSGSGERLLGYLTTDYFESVTPTSSSYRNEYQLTTGVLGPSSDTSTSSVTYYLRMWINNDPDVTYSASEINSKTLRSKIIIKSSKTDLEPTVVEDNGTASWYTLYKLGQTSNGTADLSVPIEDDTSGVYEAEDDYGTSYYFRGTKTSTNNHIIFGGFCWQIIRVNGDGSLRIMYNGTPSNGTCTTDNTVLSTSEFNTTNDNPAQVGYMYGTTLNTSYEKTHANENDSTIKGVLDTWYSSTSGLTTYADQIVDSGFCNDRSIKTQGDGYTTNTTTYFGARYRIRGDDSLSVVKNPKPTLKCSQNNDFFTVNPVSTSSSGLIGNSALTYPVALITADEASYAGLYDYSYSDEKNTKIWLVNTFGIYWTLSPDYFDSGDGSVYVWSVYGNALRYNWTDFALGVRPVINLTSEISVTGTGTTDNPYVVS